MLTAQSVPPESAGPPPPTRKPIGDDQRFFALAFCWADMVLELDDAQSVLFASGATAPLLGHPPRDLVGQALPDLVDGRDRVLMKQIFKLMERQGRVQDMVIHLRAPNGRTVPLEVAGHTLGGNGGHYFLALRVRHAAKDSAPSQTEDDRDRDSGLRTGKAFSAQAAERLREARNNGEDLEMTLLSLPGLQDLIAKMDEGDAEQLIGTVGTCLRAGSVDGDSAGRLGDGKFGFVHGADVDVADIEAEIHEATRSFDPSGSGLPVETATLETNALGDIKDEDLVRSLVYTISRFQETSGNSMSFADLTGNLNQLLDEAVASMGSFREITKEDRFDIAFHPILDVKSGHCHHYEALVRFNGDFEESPFRHITFAEETGLIPEFDIAMARKAVHWLAQRPTGKESVAVNISGNSVADENYTRQLIHLLDENTWLKGRLLFEITESAHMADLETANVFIQQLRERGFPVCLDDFGAGSSSFVYLSTLEVDVVKLDGSAVHNAQKAPKGRAFLVGLTALCKSLNVETIAEMVDSPEGLDFVRKCGVEYVQGFLFGKPAADTASFSKVRDMPVFAQNKKRISVTGRF